VETLGVFEIINLMAIGPQSGYDAGLKFIPPRAVNID
jgi:hypothetical protein